MTAYITLMAASVVAVAAPGWVCVVWRKVRAS